MIWKYLVLFPLGSPRAEIKYSWGRSWAGTFFSEMGSTEDPQAFGDSGKVRRACLGHPRASAQLQLIVVSMESDWMLSNLLIFQETLEIQDFYIKSVLEKLIFKKSYFFKFGFLIQILLKHFFRPNKTETQVPRFPSVIQTFINKGHLTVPRGYKKSRPQNTAPRFLPGKRYWKIPHSLLISLHPWTQKQLML